MAGNSIGRYLVLTTFGESHGKAVGGVLDGFPSGVSINIQYIQSEINRRNPVFYPFTSTRKEEDKIEFLSGLYEGKSTGAPIAFLVFNNDHRPEDYDHLKNLYRPSHADFTYEARYGLRDPRGGGRSSARTTLAIVAGGALAKLLLDSRQISIHAYVSRIGPVSLPPDFRLTDPEVIRLSPLSCPQEHTTQLMLDHLYRLKQEGDTAGGVISCAIRGVPAGLGDPVFGKLQADLAKAMLNINAVKGFEYGSGFAAASMKGSEHNDRWIIDEGKPITATNHSGGIQGGISNGMEITFNVAFKPVSTIQKAQQTIDRAGNTVSFEGKGRHDVCVVPRAVPIVEAMAALVIGDHLLP
jgi:chorismate synthase